MKASIWDMPLFAHEGDSKVTNEITCWGQKLGNVDIMLYKLFYALSHWCKLSFA
jgi:hypothetical protein